MNDVIHDEELAAALRPMLGLAVVAAAACAAALTLIGANTSVKASEQFQTCRACAQQINPEIGR